MYQFLLKHSTVYQNSYGILIYILYDIRNQNSYFKIGYIYV